ncbi:MAG: beta-galactosidase [Treponema sp.]|jgi:beta-galactosidase|nr:beta-galactosidase [Treponema sp.]
MFMIIPNFPHMLHGGDYNPEQWIKWKDTIWKEDMRLAQAAYINTVSVGIFSWSTLEPHEGEFHFEWLDEVLDMCAEHGIVAVLATPSGAKPAWLAQKYPEVLRVNERRERNYYGGRHNHCLSSPIYREKVSRINTLLAERYKKHPALGLWHISNEYGGECHCPLCQERFRQYLQHKFQTLESINEAWWTAFWSHTYTDWTQIESPGPLGENGLHGLNLEWKRFTTEQFVDFYLCETKPLKEITPNVPCTTNLMGTYPGIDYMRLAEVLDVAAWDSYPRWTSRDDTVLGARTGFLHDLARSLKKKPFLLIESCPSATSWQQVAKLRSPRLHVLQSMQAVAHGADSVQYFQIRKSRGGPEKFHGAVIDHEGSEHTRVFHDVQDVGRQLSQLDSLVGAQTPAQTALIYDWHVRWALDDANGFLQDKTQYEQTVIDHHRAVWNQTIPVDVIDSTRDFGTYRVLIAPMLYMIRPIVAERIKTFVEQGGIFVATYLTGYVDEHDLTFLGGFPGPLKELLGLWCEELDSLFPDMENSFEWQKKTYKVHDFCELVHLRGATSLALYEKDFYAGRPALTVHPYGKGKAYFIASRTGDDFLESFYQYIAAEASLNKALQSPLPEGVNAQIRVTGTDTFIFVMNFTHEKKTVDGGSAGIKILDAFETWIIKKPHSSC